MSYLNKLFLQGKVYDFQSTDEFFYRAVKESAEWHAARCPEYGAILAGQGFEPGQIQGIGEIFRLPPIPTLYLKKHELFSLPPEKVRFSSTTSGTSGQPVSVGFDAHAMVLGANMLRKMLAYHRLFSLLPTNYVILGYEPSARNKMGAVRTAYSSTFLAPALRREYALKDTGGDYELNIEGVVKTLVESAKKRTPVRINGFPAYLFFLLLKLREENLTLKLHPKSQIFLGGGWKQFSAQRIDREELHSMALETLGLPKASIREFFGVVEHNIPYFTCENHHFHVPAYSRVLIRDVQTLRPVGFGEKGILNLITPLLKSMPLTSILTDDIAVLHEGRECGCGIETPYFEVFGRAGLQEIKTCAAGAGSILEAEV